MNNYDYPMGSDTEDAPWNEEPLDSVEIEMDVEVTLKKRVKISIDDYSEDTIMDDGAGKHVNTIYDFSRSDLESAIKDQIILPNDAFKYIATNTSRGKKAYKDLESWDIENIETEIID